MRKKGWREIQEVNGIVSSVVQWGKLVLQISAHLISALILFLIQAAPWFRYASSYLCLMEAMQQCQCKCLRNEFGNLDEKNAVLLLRDLKFCLCWSARFSTYPDVTTHQITGLSWPEFCIPCCTFCPEGLFQLCIFIFDACYSCLPSKHITGSPPSLAYSRNVCFLFQLDTFLVSIAHLLNLQTNASVFSSPLPS